MNGEVVASKYSKNFLPIAFFYKVSVSLTYGSDHTLLYKTARKPTYASKIGVNS